MVVEEIGDRGAPKARADAGRRGGRDRDGGGSPTRHPDSAGFEPRRPRAPRLGRGRGGRAGGMVELRPGARFRRASASTRGPGATESCARAPRTRRGCRQGIARRARWNRSLSGRARPWQGLLMMRVRQPLRSLNLRGRNSEPVVRPRAKNWLCDPVRRFVDENRSMPLEYFRTIPNFSAAAQKQAPRAPEASSPERHVLGAHAFSSELAPDAIAPGPPSSRRAGGPR